MSALTRAQLLANARVFTLRNAIVEQLETVFADIPVVSHPGKLDISDVLAKATFTTPSVAVGATSVKPDGRLSGADDFVVQLAAYVIAAPDMVAGARVEGDEMALAICQAILAALSDDEFASWTLSDIGTADRARRQAALHREERRGGRGLLRRDLETDALRRHGAGLHTPLRRRA